MAMWIALAIGLASASAVARPPNHADTSHAAVNSPKRVAQKSKRPEPHQYRPAPNEQDRTLDDFRQGKIKPFAEIRRDVGRQVGGKVIDAELDRFSTPWVYRVRVLTDDGNVLSVRLDARTGRILDVKGQQ